MPFRSRAERRLWSAAGLLLGAIYVTLYPAQFALDALRERNLLRVAIVAAGSAAAVALVVTLGRRRAGWREWAAWLAAATAYVVIAARLGIVQERIHLLEYGAVALLFLAALEERTKAAGQRSPALRLYLIAALLTGLAGWIDEAIQWALPNRYYDLRDVRLNALAGSLALAALALARAVRRPEAER